MTLPNNFQPVPDASSGGRPLSELNKGDKDAFAPFPRERVLSDLRLALAASANHIAVAGPDDSIAHAFLGYSEEDGQFGVGDIDPDAIQLERFPIAGIIDRAYDFAFQVGNRSNRHEMDDGDYRQLLTFRRGSPRYVWGWTFVTPMVDDESPICRTIDTAEARQELLQREPMTVRQLALLAHMSEPAVRTSLSKEGIRTQLAHQADNKSRLMDKLGQVPNETALRWLIGRRGFVATLEPGPTDPAYVEDMSRLFRAQGFEAYLAEGTSSGHSLSSLSEDANVDPDWLLEVATGRPAKLDIDALTRIARCLLSHDVPGFVGRAVERLLRAGESVR